MKLKQKKNNKWEIIVKLVSPQLPRKKEEKNVKSYYLSHTIVSVRCVGEKEPPTRQSVNPVHMSAKTKQEDNKNEYYFPGGTGELSFVLFL